MHPHPEPPPRPGRWDDRFTALGLTGPGRRDTALAVLVAAGTLLVITPVLLEPGAVAELGLRPGPTAVALGLLTVQNLLLALRRRAPAACLAGTVALQLVIVAVLPVGAALRGPATAVAAGTCGSRLPARRSVALVGAAAVAETAAVLVGVATRPTAAGAPVGVPVLVVAQVLAAVLVYGGPLLLGMHLRTRRRYAELDRVHHEGVVATYRERADAAIARERARMARELHDVAAHHLSAMVVQAAMVERLVDRDPEEARTTASRLREQGRRTLHDLRLVVGALREPGAPGADGEHPVPGLAELDGLVAHARELGGGPVELVRTGDAREPSPVADLTCHRVVQEALANAREHAPGAPVRVTVTHDDGRVAVEVVNGPPASPPAADTTGTRGFGLAGMRERAQLVGGTFDAGPTGDGGWRVRLTVPHDPGPEPGTGGRT